VQQERLQAHVRDIGENLLGGSLDSVPTSIQEEVIDISCAFLRSKMTASEALQAVASLMSRHGQRA